MPPEEVDPAGKKYEGDGVTVWFDATRCDHFAECVHGHPEVFQPGRKPWIRVDLGEAEEIAAVVRRCPTGALHYRLEAGPPEGPKAPTSVLPLKAGPLLMRGDLRIKTPAGYVRDTRAALCGCGATANLPFCDGACGINQPLGDRD